MDAAPFRPALRYMGGKWRLAPWIVGHFPAHRTYVEPFGGAASVLLQKARSLQEVYNDLDRELVSLFVVLRDPTLCAELVRLLELTPYARVEYEACCEPPSGSDPVEAARRAVVASFMGYGSSSVSARRKKGFRTFGPAYEGNPARDWAQLPESIVRICARLQGVALENRPALEVIRRLDGPETLVFADPPYVHASRSQKRNRGSPQWGYGHEMTDQAHGELLDLLLDCRSMVVLSGYPSELYDRRLSGWARHEAKAYANGSHRRCEVLWLNPAAADAGGLFGPRP